MKLNHTEEEIRALVDGATPGPWCRGSSVIGSLCVYGGGHGGNAGRYLIAQVDDIGGTGAADTRFIAAAPTIAADALAMHAEIARLRAENERIRARLADMLSAHQPALTIDGGHICPTCCAVSFRDGTLTHRERCAYADGLALLTTTEATP